MSRAFLAILAAVVLAFISAVGGCSEGQSGGSGENPSTIATSLTYQGIPVQDRWIDICYGSGFSQEELLCTTSYVANSGLTDQQGRTTLQSVPPGPAELCVSTDYILPVRICEQPANRPLDPNLRCQSDADCQGVPTQCVCRFDKPDCGINLNGAACSTDAQCAGTNPDSVCSGICGGKKANNYFFQTVGFCTSTWEGTCSTQLCSIGSCQDSGAPCTLTEGCGEGIECLFSECVDDSDCTLGGICETSTCASDLDCAVGSVCQLPPDLQTVCSSTGENCRSQEECPLGDSCAVPVTVCSVSGADCSANKPCSERNCSVDIDIGCSTDSECASLRNVCSISATTCVDDSECPSGETCGPQTCETEMCVNRLPGTPCYSVTGGLAESGGCPKYCGSDPSLVCNTVADCDSSTCRRTGEACSDDEPCVARVCAVTLQACSSNSECSGGGPVVRLCSESQTPCSSSSQCPAGEICSRNNCAPNTCETPAGETCGQRDDEACLRLSETTSVCADPLPANLELKN